MDAGRLQNLTIYLGCCSSCVHMSTYGQCHLSPVLLSSHKVLSANTTLHDCSNAFGQILKTKSPRREKKHGVIHLTEASLVHDIAAAAVAVATVLPICWLYLKRLESSSSSSSLSASCSTRTSNLNCNSGALNDSFEGARFFVTESASTAVGTQTMQSHASMTMSEESLQSTKTLDDCKEKLLGAGATDLGGKNSVLSESLPSHVSKLQADIIKGNEKFERNPEALSDGLELADFIVDMVHKSRVTNQDMYSEKNDELEPESVYLSSADTTSEIVDRMWLSQFRTDSSAGILPTEMQRKHDPYASSDPCTSKETLKPTFTDVKNVPAHSLTLDQSHNVQNAILSHGASTGFEETSSDYGEFVNMVRTSDSMVHVNSKGSALDEEDKAAEAATDHMVNDGESEMLEHKHFGNFSDKHVRYSLVKEKERLSVQNNHHPSAHINGMLSLQNNQTLSNTAQHLADSRSHIANIVIENRQASQLRGEHHLEAHLSAYNRFIRSNRLIEALKLLEDLDRIGTLNMDKIYHGRFYKVCEEKQAVKEAFRFTRLIKNPTLKTFNMLLSVCSSAADVKGAFRVLDDVQRADLKADCMLYTNLISTCAKAGKVDLVFQVFHEMESIGVQANVHTYAAMIDSCARTGQVAKAFGFYQIMSSKNIKADRVIFNSLINVCGRSGALERAFSVLSKMKDEKVPVEPDHVTMGSLIDACSRAGEVERAFEVYNTMRKMGIKGTTEAYTAAIHTCSQSNNLALAFQIYADMKKDSVQPDEVCFSALIDVAGSSGDVGAAFDILKEMKNISMVPGVIVYSALMGVCSKTEKWETALELYKEMRTSGLVPTVSTFNALLTALCNSKQLQRALEVFHEMKQTDSVPNEVTYTILLKACEVEDEADVGIELYLRATSKGVITNLQICNSIIGLCLRRVQRDAPPPQFACPLGPLHTITGKGDPHEHWASWALAVYRQTISAGIVPTIKLFSRLLGCLRIPISMPPQGLCVNGSLLTVSNLGNSSKHSMMEGFGIYDPRALSLFEEVSAHGVAPHFSYTTNPLIFDAKTMPTFAAEVCVLTILKGLKHRHAAGARIPSVIIHLDVDKIIVDTPNGNTKLVTICSRTGQQIDALLKRLRLHHNGYASSGRLRISGKEIKRWFNPSILETKTPPLQLLETLAPSSVLGKGILDQQRAIRMAEFSRSEIDVRSILPQNRARMMSRRNNTKSNTTRENLAVETPHTLRQDTGRP